ncbi:MAG: hypothetical protein NVSMB14_08450 [Isosphaeraceae bacterium]
MGQSSDTHDSSSFSPRASRSVSESSPIHTLEELRQRVHRRLDHIQDLLHDRLARTVLDKSEGNGCRRIEELEEAVEAAKNETRRAEVERMAALEKLEQDRCLLAEAWERLERERIDFEAGRDQIALDSNPPPRTLSSAANYPPLAPVRSASSSPGDDSVERAIFQQFQALKRDVRRKADSRNVD